MRVLYQLAGVAIVAVIGVAGWAWLNQQQAGSAEQDSMGQGGAVPVEVVIASTGVVQETVSAVGNTLARESVDIVAEVAGRITTIHFEEGQRVSAGDMLFELDQSAERAELREAIAERDDARAKHRRFQALREDDSVSQSQVDELAALLEAAEARVAGVRSRLADRQIRAPFDGTTGLREVSLGAYVAPGTRLTTLDDLSVVRVDFSVPERFLSTLGNGLQVQARNVAFIDRTFEGEVVRVATRVDPVTRAVRVQSEFDNDHGQLRPGMFMTVQLVLEQRDGAVLIPEEALVSQGQSTYAFIISDDDSARRVELSTGQRRDGLVEIRDGIEPGQAVVVAGLQRLRDGATVRVLSTDNTSAMAGR